MHDLKDHLSRLLGKTSWTIEEKQWLLKYFETSDGKELESILLKQFENTGGAAEPDEETSRVLLEKIHEKIGSDICTKRGVVVRFRKWRAVAAASIIALLGITAYFLANHANKKEVAQKQAPQKRYKNDVAPGTNKAILVLADGRRVILDDTQNGLVTTQGNSKIIKIGNRLAYKDSGSTANHILYNTISTPRAAQYQIELPDGSLAWLNAASSLRFPTAFADSERRVEVTGEVYFEVAALRHRSGRKVPFVVTINGAEVQVLGTHFNVMAYNDEEAMQTTLLEGKVKVVNGQWAILKPGEQASISHTSHASQPIPVQTVDLNQVMAWKNGMFDFENTGIETVMRQIARWYDVDVVFKSHNNKDLFMLEMPRSSKLSDILKILELTGNIKFEIDGKKVIVFA